MCIREFSIWSYKIDWKPYLRSNLWLRYWDITMLDMCQRQIRFFSCSKSKRKQVFFDQLQKGCFSLWAQLAHLFSIQWNFYSFPSLFCSFSTYLDCNLCIAQGVDTNLELTSYCQAGSQCLIFFPLVLLQKGQQQANTMKSKRIIAGLLIPNMNRYRRDSD